MLRGVARGQVRLDADARTERAERRRDGKNRMTWPHVIIFDCDGVLVDSEIISLEETRSALEVAGLPLTLDEVRERFLGVSAASLIASAETDIGRSLPGSFHKDLTSAILGRFENELRGIAGIRPLLAALGVSVCVASSSTPERIRRSLEIVGYGELFEPHIFSATMVKRGKPFPDLFEHAAAAMGAAPADCLVIEDSVMGVRAAVAAGITVFGFTGGSHLAGTMQRDRLIEAGAARVFDAMEDLPDMIAPRRAPAAAAEPGRR
jgi:HAD superfamily hydrolase (TIGR01509 family)